MRLMQTVKGGVSCSSSLGPPQCCPASRCCVLQAVDPKCPAAAAVDRAVMRMILTTLLLGKAVERVVALTELADEAGQGEDGRLARDGAAVGVNVSNGDLHRSVVLGLNDAASGGALSGDVKVNKVSL